MSLTRRRLGLLAPAAMLAPCAFAQGAAPRPPLTFAVWREGRRIGAHSVTFGGTERAMTVHSQARFSVGLGPVTLFRYLYQSTESWQDGRLAGFDATTDNNGRPGTCRARADGARLAVTGSKTGDYAAPAGSIAATHWNPAELGAPMINPEDGVLMQFAVANKGSAAPPGGGAPATRYALTGFATIDLWYDAGGRWCGLRAVAKDSTVIEYRQA